MAEVGQERGRRGGRGRERGSFGHSAVRREESRGDPDEGSGSLLFLS